MNTTFQISRTENIILWTIRILVGVLFILSGYSKLIDPNGLAYKMEEFNNVLGWTWFKGHELFLSVCMIAFEIIAGFALLIGYRTRIFSWLLLLLTLFFTFLTAYALFSNKITECGCFGGCVKLTNTETFWKDVVLTILIVYLVIRQKYILPLIGNGMLGTLAMIVVAIAAFGAQFWVLKHGALVDCLPYKVGDNIPANMKEEPGCIKDSVDYKFVYTKGNEKKELAMDALNQIDSTWTFVERKEVVVRKGNCEMLIKDFKIVGYDGADVTTEVLNSPENCILYIAKNINDAQAENVAALKSFTDKAMANGLKVYGCSASSQEETAAFLQANQLGFSFYTMDETLCKTALRTNSGLIILKQGTVIYKCSSPDFPRWEAVVLN